jgi:oligosaccharide repeat unit polymerase
MWLIDVVVYRMSLIELDRVHTVTWLLVCGGAFLFSLAGWVAGLLPGRIYTLRIAEFSRPAVSRLGLNLLVLVCLLALPIYFYHFWSGGIGSGGGLFENARKAALDTVATDQTSLARNPITSYLPVYSIWVTILCLMEGKDRRFWTAFGASLTICILATGRTLPLLLFSSTLAIYLITQRKDHIRRAWRVIAGPAIVFLALVIGIIFLEKSSKSFGGNMTAFLLNYTVAYLVSPLPALDYVLHHGIEYMHAPSHTFGFLLRALNAFGYSFPMPNDMPVSGYVFVPLPTNVYTIYKPYLLDFGFIGLAATILTIGFIQTFLYLRAIAGDKICLFVTALLVFPAVLSVFDDSYAQPVLQVMWVGLAVLYFGFLRRLKPTMSLGALFSSRPILRGEPRGR